MLGTGLNLEREILKIKTRINPRVTCRLRGPSYAIGTGLTLEKGDFKNEKQK
jgi:hypothetical protein